MSGETITLPLDDVYEQIRLERELCAAGGHRLVGESRCYCGRVDHAAPAPEVQP